jgi:hypothetical protein
MGHRDEGDGAKTGLNWARMAAARVAIAMTALVKRPLLGTSCVDPGSDLKRQNGTKLPTCRAPNNDLDGASPGRSPLCTFRQIGCVHQPITQSPP